MGPYDRCTYECTPEDESCDRLVKTCLTCNTQFINRVKSQDAEAQYWPNTLNTKLPCLLCQGTQNKDSNKFS